jgi:hypothetical protein
LSFRRKVSHFLALVVVAALAVGLMAGPASAKMSAKHKAQVRQQLRKAVKKNPKVITKRSFLKKAALVNFKLPVTVRLRGYSGPTASSTNPNSATIDLGPSLGQRSISLGGKLAAEIEFQDSFDGGALGNVNLSILPSTSKALTSTSIPLLWNDQVSQAGTDYAASLTGSGTIGCGNFTGTSGLPFGPFPAVPYYDSATFPAGYPGSPLGFVPEVPGPDSIDKLAANKSTSPASPTDDVNNHLGGSTNPFPSGPFSTPNVQDAVLRTNALTLSVASPGTPVNQSNGAGPNGSQDIVIGKSGGQANLFGDIPGKNYGIDVTVSLATQINSIIRSVDADAARPLLSGLPYTSASFVCRQAWTGSVQNYIPGVRLQGDLKISPAITPDGKLRIAKATLSSLDSNNPTRVALAACLSPYSVFAPQNNSSDTATVAVPAAAGPGPGGGNPSSVLPIDDSSAVGRPAPGVACDSLPTKLVQDAGFAGIPNPTDPAYTVSNDGSKVSVAGDLKVNNVSADVLIGDV